MTEFQEKGYTLVKGFLDPQAVATVSRYLEYKHKRYPETNEAGGANSDPNSKIAWYADPLIETILYNSTADIEQITGLKLFPSYSYSRIYTKGDELKPHVDRPACEISITCHVATVGEPWPIYMQAPGKEATKHILEPGDVCVYKGCEIKHWRETAVNTDINVQFMLHYTDQNGPNASHKFDRRVSLGIKKG
jgi:hypothetical protein